MLERGLDRDLGRDLFGVLVLGEDRAELWFVLRAADSGADARELGGDAFGVKGVRHGGSNRRRRCGNRRRRGGGLWRGGLDRGFELFCGGDRGQIFVLVDLAQHDSVFLNARLDPALHFALGNLVQHLGIGGGRFRTEIAVVRREVAKILGDRAHR